MLNCMSDSLIACLDLKPLRDSLECLILDLNESLHVIINFDLDPDQEEKLIMLLRENKEATCWTL